MQSREFTIPDIGSFTIRKNPKAKRIILRVLPNGKPMLTIPNTMSFDSGVGFVIDKKDWIERGIKRMSDRVGLSAVFDTEQPFVTRFSKIYFQNYKGAEIMSHKKGGDTYMLFPQSLDIKSDEGQGLARTFVIEALRKEAKNYLPARIKYLADKYSFSYNKVFIKNLKTRWGSCSSQNNINLNLHIMRMPEYLSDFIILHELCHTVHKNHGSDFHLMLNGIVGNEKQLNKELKNYNTSI